MASSLILTAPAAMTAPLPGTPVLRLKGEKYTFGSDSFTGADSTTLAGRITDARLGGTSEPWSASVPGAFGIDSGRLVPGETTADSFAALTRPPGVVEVAVTVNLIPSNNKTWLVGTRDAISGPTNQVRVDIDSGGAQIVHMIAGYPSGAIGTRRPLRSGSQVRLKVDGKKVTMSIDGIVTDTGELPAACPGNYVGMARSSGATSFGFSGFVCQSYVQ